MEHFEYVGEYPLLSYKYYFWDWTGGECGGSFSVKVVPPARPINFRCTNASSGDDGVLHYIYHYVYLWDSSTGNLANLDGCTIKERISYEGNTTGQPFYDENGNLIAYLYPLPFDEFHVNPEAGEDVPGTDGVLHDDHVVPKISEPYQPGSFLSTQYYTYVDDTMDANNPNDYVALRGPIDIIHTVWSPGINWVYDVFKSDYPDALPGNYLEARKILGPIYP